MTIDYQTKALFVGINLLVYLGLHLPLDLSYHLFSTRSATLSNTTTRPAAWKNGFVMTITTINSLTFWVLFVIVSLEFFLKTTLLKTFFYPIIPYSHFWCSNINYLATILGTLTFLLGTCVACLGRIYRRHEPISWGILDKLVATGIFRWIQHPLYASYCYYFLGFLLLFNNILLLPLLLGIYGYNKTADYEEEILIKQFGDQYREYQKHTGKFFHINLLFSLS